MEINTIHKGVYLVIDPALPEELLLSRLASALQQPLAAVQVWDHFETVEDPIALCSKLIHSANAAGVPILINNRWEYLLHLHFDGVHFDTIPHDLEAIEHQVGRPFIQGLTCGNDLDWVRWAVAHQFDYISFCSIFPSVTSNSCELVKRETLIEARQLTSMPLFLAGGISPDHIEQLTTLDYDGVAVVSGVMSSDDPAAAVSHYLQKLNLT